MGASGYVLKSVADEAFVYTGAMGALVRDYLGRLARGAQVPRTLLTPREDEVFKLVAEAGPRKRLPVTGWSSPATRSGPG